MRQFRRASGAWVAAILVVFLLVPAVLLASGGATEEEGALHPSTLWRGINLLVIVGVIVWAARKKDVGGLLRSRREGIERELAEAKQALERSAQQLRENEKKLDRLEEELRALRAQEEEALEAEKISLRREMEERALAIGKAMDQRLEDELRRSKAKLRELGARIATEAAEAEVARRLDDQQHRHLVDQAIEEIERG